MEKGDQKTGNRVGLRTTWEMFYDKIRGEGESENRRRGMNATVEAYHKRETAIRASSSSWYRILMEKE